MRVDVGGQVQAGHVGQGGVQPGRGAASVGEDAGEFGELSPGDGAGEFGHPVVEAEADVLAASAVAGPALVGEQAHRRASAGSSVMASPPSPQVMCFHCWRLKQPIAPAVPTRVPSG
nr:hypothetical protein [Micromonospora coxensis]